LVRLALVAGLALSATAAAAETQTLVILHDNDLHGHLRSYCYVETGVRSTEACGVGGAARRATLIAALRRKATAPVLVIDAGDTSTRGPLATQYEGLDEVAAMNAIGYDMAAIGNNEFKLRDALDKDDAPAAQAALHRLITASKFPWLCANVTDDKGQLLDGAKPFVVRKVGRLKVAFLGLTTLKSVRYSQTKDLHFQDPVEAAAVWIPKARAEADVVIAVTHLGVDGDQRLAHQSHGLSAIVGGDSHTFLYQELNEPDLDGKPVPVVQDGEFGADLGELKLKFERTGDGPWTLVHSEDRLIPVNAAIAPNHRIAALVEHYAAPLDVRVGELPDIAPDYLGRKRQTAEVLAAAWRSATGADVGLEPEDAPYDAFRTRRVTRYQVRAILPFHEDVVTVSLTGAALQGLLAAKPRPFVGALHLTLSPEAIDPAKSYRVAMVRAVTELIGVAGAEDSGEETRDALEHYLAQGRP
jgi:2',3'-cyclic-nucleotide 2'-phosphodiesterase (5'-nucleotidase family)